MANNNQTLKKPPATYSSTTFFIIIGVLLLVFIIVYSYNKYKKNQLLTTSITLPYAMCPDYWDSIGNGKCQNTNNLGSCSKSPGNNIVDFSTEIFTNKNIGDYTKCKWANKCNVSWSNINRLC